MWLDHTCDKGSSLSGINQVGDTDPPESSSLHNFYHSRVEEVNSWVSWLFFDHVARYI